MSPTRSPTIYVVDDDDQVTTALRRVLRSANYQVQVFSSGGEFLNAYDPRAAGCVLLDIGMPDLDGLELQDILKARNPHSVVVFLTGTADIASSVRAMKAGASDFLTKPIDSESLLAAVAEALKRDTVYRGMDERCESIRRAIATLTARERQVLDLVVEGMMHKQIACELEIAEKTVKLHRHRMMRKLGARTVGELVRKVTQYRQQAADLDTT